MLNTSSSISISHFIIKLQRMTGYINTKHNPTSLLTIAGLADLGYTVDYSKADPTYNGYSMNNDVPGCCNPPQTAEPTLPPASLPLPTQPPVL